jgi:hypothetical protein
MRSVLSVKAGQEVTAESRPRHCAIYKLGRFADVSTEIGNEAV